MSRSTVSTTVVLTTLLGASSTSFGQVVLMDQIGADDGSSINAGYMWSSQIFEAAYSVYDVAAIDDFEFNGAQQVTSMSMVLVGWSGYVGLDGIQGLSANLYFSPEDAGVSLIGYANADVMGSPTGDPNWAGPDELVHVDVELSASLGTVYVALIPINEYGTNGQTGCGVSTLGDGNAWQANPDGGFGFGPLQSIPDNLAYRVMGSGPDCNDNGIPDEDEIAEDPSLDCNDNGWLDTCEIAAGYDCNANGIVDACDIADGTSQDCNGNGVPDECDAITDCNNNGIEDSCDIADGTSTDCNGNGVPDECEPFEDCNKNGVLDACDISSGSSTDCNADGVPDECEPFEDCNENGIRDICDIADGTSEDCNGNGIPDECEGKFWCDCNGNDIADYEEIEADPTLDCNTNGWLDECELEEGNDCNANGVVDVCDIADGQAEDCNGNGVPDMCDIDNGSAQDCNNNLVPDDCDIADGTSQDLDGDGVPDECPFDCAGYFVAAPLQQPDGNYEYIAPYMDVGHGVVAITAQKVYPSGRRFHLHLYDSNSLELIADVPTNANGTNVLATLGSQLALAEDFIALSHIYGGDPSVVSIVERVNGNWMQTSTIQPSVEASGSFGYSVAAANNHIAVSDYERGVVFLYHRDGTANWALQQIVERPSGSSSSWGFSLEMDGDWLAIADFLYGGGEIDMYRFDGTNYEYHSTVVQEVQEGDFGAHISMDAGVLVCGKTQVNNSSDDGNVEVHRWNGDAWVFEATLPQGANLDEQYGVSVCVQGNRVGVGATNYSYGGGDGESAGAYVFERQTDGAWHEIVRVEDPDFNPSDLFGFSCVVTPGALLVGEPRSDLPAYVYGISPSLDPDDCNSNGICDGLDIAAGGGTDCDGSGVLDQCEIDAGLVDDIDGNGIPDLCELDCDGDGLPDAYELASGSGFDCNANGQLDNCDISSGQSPDGDGDGVPDECSPDFVITVAADGSGMFSELQAAIDLSIPGSRIEVQPGVYDGSIVFPGHDFELVSVGPAQDTIIDAKGTGRVVFIGEGHTNATLLDGFTLQNGVAIHQGGGILIRRSTPTIRNCLIRDCAASIGGGVAVYDTPDGDARCVFYASIIEDNFSTGEDLDFNSSGGAGMDCVSARVQLVACLIKGNQAARYEGGIQATDIGAPNNTTLTDLLLQQCEISGNVGSPGSGVLALGSTVVRVEDTLICGNATSNGVLGGIDVDLGWNLFWDDCHDCNENGIDDAQEIIDGAVTDVDNDGIPDECETDCDDDGTTDPLELFFGDADDVDGDGHPDNCELDCNDNAIPDDYEIEQGWAPDCNDNLIPDDCDLEDPQLDCNGDGLLDACQELDEESDCDGNGLIDACEILADPSLDCNGSNTLDSCDVDSGSSEDLDGDGIPDECQCLGDLNGDFFVGVDDLLLVLSQFGLSGGSADIDYDGIVGVSDILAMLSAWGPCA